jgi:glycosyltransferase involved in cell wall biosynthesis
VISVVTATYNRAETLPRALNSLLNQTCPDWECILVDDGSTDGTSDVIARLADPRIRVYVHPVNRGVSAAKNTGLDNMRGEWFTLLDSDDELVPEALEIVLGVAKDTGATSVLANSVDSVTGEMAGIGPSHEGWLTPKESTALRGDHWGITKTDLLGDMRFNERLPGGETTLWTRLNRTVDRYYIHRALSIYHTEGADMVTKRHLSMRQKVDLFAVLGEESEYLKVLGELDPPQYRRTMLRIWAARILDPIVPRG